MAEDKDVDQAAEMEHAVQSMEPEVASSAIVLHEDKKYYPDAEEVYEPDVEVLIMQEDAQPLETPIYAPPKSKNIFHLEKSVPETAESVAYMAGLLSHPSLARNVVFAGHLHHGKSSILDMFVDNAKILPKCNASPVERYTDHRMDEQARGLSLKLAPMTFVVPDLNGKSYLFNTLDTPGHPDFLDEAASALPLCDGLCLLVDVVEGLSMVTKEILSMAARVSLPIVVVLNKIDRLIVELKLPPVDAFFKIRAVLQELTDYYKSVGGKSQFVPTRGNVVFASSLFNFTFTLDSFARLYCEHHGMSPSLAGQIAKNLWGDVTYRADTRQFVKIKTAGGPASGMRTFISFILEPLYKIFSLCLGEEASTIQEEMSAFGIRVSLQDCQLSAQPLLQLVLPQWFGVPIAALVQAVVAVIPSPHTQRAIAHYVDGAVGDALQEAVAASSPTGPLVMHVCKLLPNSTATSFGALARVYSGTVKPGMEVRILGENYSADDEEDSAVARIGSVSLCQTRYFQDITAGFPGNLVLLGGIDPSIVKSATVTSILGPVSTFLPLRLPKPAVLKVAVEPLQPSELPQMLSGIRNLSKYFVALKNRVEESGEHVLIGTGELYMDVVLHDLRTMFAEIEVKVSDPLCSFCETVSMVSSLPCKGHTANGKNQLEMIAEPLENSLVMALESGNLQHLPLQVDGKDKRLRKSLQDEHGWDVLAARRLWSVSSTNVLLDDSLPTEEEGRVAAPSIRQSLQQGFAWATREGPLCEEPLRGCKFRLLDCDLAPALLHRSGGQIIPTARRVMYSALLLAQPRLLEPVISVEIRTLPVALSALYRVLGRRRGHILSEGPLSGTPLTTVVALVPMMDSFGLDTDIRLCSSGAAFGTMSFDVWAPVPGNPLDPSVELRPLEVSEHEALAREFTTKTRLRKGLTPIVNPEKYLDDPAQIQLVRQMR